LAITVLAGLGVGHVADARFGTSPVFFELGGGLGVVLALYQFFRTVSRK
jgi:F0F1-type ATP synthase assembly protein I